MRIAIAGISMEALARSPLLTERAFVQIYRGDELINRRLWLVRGMVDRLKEDAGVEIVPLLWATALPGGAMALDIYEDVKAETLDLLVKQGPFDGVLLANHGALEVDGMDRHADTDFITAVRDTIGDVPLSCALDLHGHITPEMAQAVTVFSALRTAPHRDDCETGYRAAQQLLEVLRRGLKPKNALVQIPILSSGEGAVTHWEPAKSLYEGLWEMDTIPGVMQSIFMVGFWWEDAPYTGMAALVTAESDQRLADQLAIELAQRIWDARAEYKLRMETAEVDEGIIRAAKSKVKPVFLSDAGDNTTAGAPGDLTLVLQRILELKVSDAVVAGITGFQTVKQCHEAGIGAEIELVLGREHISVQGHTMTVKAVVEGLGDDLELPGFQPYRTREGMWARVRIGNIIATFHELPIGITTPNHFSSMGINPTEHQMYVVKEGYLFPQLEDLGGRHILLYSRGTTDLDISQLGWKHVRRPIYPLDLDMNWTPQLATVEVE